MSAGFALVIERESAARGAIEVEGTRGLAKSIPRLSDSLGTERQRMPSPVSRHSVREPGPWGGLALGKQMHKRKGQEGGKTS